MTLLTERILWSRAEKNGLDLTLLAQQWKQEELNGLAAQRLSNSDIVEIMDEDCVRIVKRQISRVSREINPFLDEVRVIKSMDLTPYAQILAIWALRCRCGVDGLIVRRNALRSVLAAALVKQGVTEVQFESITERDVENAKSVPIEGLYDWEKPARISGRFRACCPFHAESTGSFFVFRDNKYRCFGCSEHGDAIDFTMKTIGIEFIEAVKYLIRR